MGTVELLREQFRVHEQNLAKLELQAARYGMDVPLALLNHIDFEKQKIEELRGRLAEAFYAEGQRHFRAQRWAEAMEAFEQALVLVPGCEDVEALLAEARAERARAEQEKKLEGLYQQATAAQQGGQWAKAIGLFEELLVLRPGYRDAKARLSGVRRAMEEEKERREREEKLAALYGQAEEALGARQWAKATELLEEVLALDASYRDAASRLFTAREEMRREEKERRLAGLYERGLGCLEQKRWTEAIEHLRAIVAAEPGYRDAQQLLTRARWEMAAEQEERLLNVLYERGVDNLEAGRWSQAITVFEKVLAERPEHAEAVARLEEARREQELASLYDQAQKALKGERWPAAVEVLEKVVGLETGYRDSQALLVQAREKLAEAEEWERRARRQAELYERGLGHLGAEEWSQAVACFEELQRLEPGYRDVARRLATARAEIERPAEEERRRAEAKAEKARAKAAVLPTEMVKPVAFVEEEVAPFWQRVPVWGWAAVGAAVLLIAAGANFLDGRGGKPTPAPVAMSVPTATAVPTVTPVPPTPTPVVPTDTPILVPTPTPTPTPTLPVIGEYVDEFMEELVERLLPEVIGTVTAEDLSKLLLAESERSVLENRIVQFFTSDDAIKNYGNYLADYITAEKSRIAEEDVSIADEEASINAEETRIAAAEATPTSFNIEYISGIEKMKRIRDKMQKVGGIDTNLSIFIYVVNISNPEQTFTNLANVGFTEVILSGYSFVL